MSRFALVLSAVLLLSCGSSGSSNPEDTQTTDTTTDLEALDIATDQEPAQDLLPDGVEDAVEEADVLTNVTGLSDEMAQAFCPGVCELLAACGVEFEGGDCTTFCPTAAKTDDAFAEQLVCAGLGLQDAEEGTDDFCQTWSGCGQGFEPRESCNELCDKVDACGGLQGLPFGWNTQDCRWVCTIALEMDEAPEETLGCLDNALDSCDAPLLMSCIGAGDDMETICAGPLCDLQSATDCGIIPDPFADEAACRSACDGFTPGQEVMSNMCLEFGQELPLGCSEVALRCLEPSGVLTDGALEYASALLAKCPTPVEQLYGQLKDSLAAYALEGIRLALPELFVSYEQGLTCLETLDTCPSADLSLIACLLNVPEQGAAACETLVDVCDEAQLEELFWGCKITAAFAHVIAPDMESTVYDCLTSAATCEEKQACFGNES